MVIEDQLCFEEVLVARKSVEDKATEIIKGLLDIVHRDSRYFVMEYLIPSCYI